MTGGLRRFLALESSGGILLFLAALAAVAMKNSPVAFLYDALLDTPVALRVGALEIAKPLLLWVNDGLMALFFFLIGLELKREVVEGSLSRPSRLMLPVVAAVGGMAMPAAIYAAVNHADPSALRGWAIPSATDIAFALGVLALLGRRVPRSLKLFLMALAIVDDLGAIVIIALFYSGALSVGALAVCAAAVGGLWWLNRHGRATVGPYLAIGLILWVSVLKSGVHATLAGVVVALFIPLRGNGREGLLRRLERRLHPWVTFGVLPFFAFANAGIPLAALAPGMLLHPVSLGIACGLFFGNQIGVFGGSWLAVRLGLAGLPERADWLQLYGIALLCGIGFTMSLFIGSLAFEQGMEAVVDERAGIMVGSLLSGLAGSGVLWYAGRRGQGG
ncbi:MAG: Na+/H+ antiporter NhaA [Zetaproteobacteria bacterium]|nr:MAG: Na+/H+ antiporter NhaA [Zetaproteobacteria bacterium]